MPIELHCTGCQTLLSIPDEAAGEQAKCSECGTLMTIPPLTGEGAMRDETAAGSGASPFQTGATELPSNPYEAPASTLGRTAPTYSRAELTRGAVEVNEVLAVTWAIFKEHLGTLALFGLCILGVQIGTQLVNMPLGIAAELLGKNNITLFVLLQVVQQAWGLLVGAFVTCITVTFGLNLLRANTAAIRSMWNVGPYFFRILGFQFLLILMFAVLGGLCAIPFAIGAVTQNDEYAIIGGIVSAVLAMPAVIFAIYFVFAIYLTNFFIIDRGDGVIEGIKNSMHFMNGNKLPTFLIGLIVGLCVFALIVFTCGLGLLPLAVLGAPYFAVLMTVIYFSATGQWRENPASSL